MNRATRTLHSVDVPLPGGRVLRVGMLNTPEEQPETLVLALGWGEGRSWREWTEWNRGEGLALPADALPALREALDRLA